MGGVIFVLESSMFGGVMWGLEIGGEGMGRDGLCGCSVACMVACRESNGMMDRDVFLF